jgi:hypothetical protein
MQTPIRPAVNHCGLSLRFFTLLAAIALVGFFPSAGQAQQSAYYQAVTNLQPVAYLPLQETVQPPIGDVETNLGSLGPVANAVYSSINVTKGSTPSATADGDTAAFFLNANAGGFLAVPTTDQRVSVPVGPFSVETWVYMGNFNGFVGLVSQSGANPGGLNGGGKQGGWCLSANMIAYLDAANLRGFDFHVYNGNSPASGNGGPRGGAEVAVPFNYLLNTWYHLVATFDGTNCTLYINGTNMNSQAAFRMAMPAGTSYVRDTWDPLTIGCSRGINNNRFGGSLDEVAIYTNVLNQTQVQNHFNAAAGVNYQSSILTDNPYMYWRMDAPTYIAPDPSTYPTASFYSANGTTMNVGSGTLANPVYGTATKPGVAGPQFPGLLDPALGNQSYAVAINGLGGANGGAANVNIGNAVTVPQAIPVDLGYNALLNPLAPPFSVSAWFRGNPAEANGSGRFQNIFGHTDSGWRCAMDQNGKVHFKPGNNGTEITSARVYNDGNWHHLVATCNTTNFGGSAEVLYVDGVVDSTAASAFNFAGSLQDVLIGGDPQYLNTGNAPITGYSQRLFGGSVAHFAFFTNALSAAQVSTLYQSVGAPPAILSQPFPGPRVQNGGTPFLFFGVVASGSAPLSYQWFRTNSSGVVALADDAVKYVGSTTFQVTVSNLVDSDTGNYFVVITNNYGAITSSISVLQVDQEPVITSQTPAGGLFPLVAGQTPSAFSATVVAATNNLTYQWYTNGGAIPGATALTLPLPAAQSSDSGTVLTLIVTNIYGAATSAPVTFSVSARPAPPTNAFAQSTMALNPQGYWPMHEIEPPLAQRDSETNYGTLGKLADAYYGDWQVIAGGGQNVINHQQTGALANDPNPAVSFTGANGAPSGGSYAVIPRTSPLTTIKAPFTLEAWVKPFNNTFGIILGVGSQTANSGLNSGANEGGFDWLWAGSANTFSITMRNGIGTGSTEPKTSANYFQGQWYHLVTTYDGTNIAYYINGAQDGLQNSPAATLNPNTWAPLTIGGGRWTGTINNQFQGEIDELAVYTNILSVTDIQTHYTAGASGAAGAYKADVLANNPLLYYRMDSPTYSQPAVATWPVLTNYGSSGVQGVYKPNAVPGGVAGPSTAGFPATALAGDGNSIFADAGYDTSFNPIGTNTPMSVSVWFKANPADVQQRNWQTLVGHTDQGWRCNFNAGNGAVGFDSGNGLDVRSTKTYNDGIWHQVVGTYDGSNTLIYVDGLLAGSGVRTTGNAIQTGFGVYLGSSPNGQFNAAGGRAFAGNICEAAVWNNQAIPSSQVLSLYNAAQLAPYITQQPTNGNANELGTYTNSVVAGGSNPLSYQWYRNNLPISGQTNATLGLNPVQASDNSSNYFVVVTGFGSVTSSVVSLNVATSPVFTREPAYTNLTLIGGGHATFSITASGALPLRYQWYSNNVALVGATNTSYTLNNAPIGGPYNYFCTVTNFLGSTNSFTVVVNVAGVSAPYAITVLTDNPIGFWRLDECPDDGLGNQGRIAHDSWGGNDGVYTNAQICQLPGYNSHTDASEPVALFGMTATDSDVGGIPNIDFAAPTNVNSSFSVEAWVNGQTQNAGGGPIVSKGYGAGGEEFTLDCGAGAAHNFRWFVRLANGTAPNVFSTIAPDTATYGTWYHLVGVCDEVNNKIQLYINGVSAGITPIPANSGILSSTYPVTIGARSSGISVPNNDSQFFGQISQVAIYNYALSSNQVAAHFNSAGISPIIMLQPPAGTNVNENGTLVIPAAAIGTPPLSYQWIDATTLAPLPNQTNATLVITNYPLSGNGLSYQLVITNQYGATNSSPVSISVNSGAPVIVQDLPSRLVTFAGAPLGLSVTVTGTEPFTYAWYENGSVIPGAASNPLGGTVAYGSNNFYVVVANSFAPAATSQTAAVIGAAGSPPATFPPADSTGWTLNAQANGAPILTNGILRITENLGSESRQAWYNTKVDVSRFLVQFTYTDVTGGTAGADGITFMIQGVGTGAMGGGGGSLGASGITPSVDLALNIYHGTTPPGPAIGWNLNGGSATPTATAPLVLDNGSHPIKVVIYYDGTTAKAWLTDATAGTAAPVISTVANIPAAVGNPAYVGFTGATGGAQAAQEISNFSFATVTFPTLSAQVSGSNRIISWPASTSSLYQLQSASQVTGPWTTVSGTITAANGQIQYVIPNTGGNVFYRLVLPIQ